MIIVFFVFRQGRSVSPVTKLSTNGAHGGHVGIADIMDMSPVPPRIMGNVLVKSVSRENEDRIDRILSKIDPGMQEVIKTALRSFVQAIRVEQ